MHRALVLLSVLSALLLALPAAAQGNSSRIVLLLPLDSAAFGRAAEATRQGFLAAAALEPDFPVSTQSVSDQPEEFLTAYRQVAQAKPALIVGPLTRSAVTALSASAPSVPTLALNLPESALTMPDNLYLFSLAVESEARQIARQAFAEGRRTALAITARSALAKRMQGAFLDEWMRLGGTLTANLSLPTDPARLPKLREAAAQQAADMIFLAADAEQARSVRPYLDIATPTYATSQVYAGNGETGRNHDLNGIRFTEMPWFLIPDHPAVMAYPRPEAIGIDLERFYALGIDAFRLATWLVQNPSPPEGMMLDGVTGQITLTARQFTRESEIAQFRQGDAVATGNATP